MFFGTLFLKDVVCKVLYIDFLKVFHKPSFDGWFEDFDAFYF